jgi:hypothetical protein
VAPCVENDSGAFTGPDGATYDRFPFSNTLSDTITASVATFNPTNGAKKNTSVTLSNSNLTASCLSNIGANLCVAATFAAINTKFTTEITIVSNNTSGVSGFGFYDGSNPSFATAVSAAAGLLRWAEWMPLRVAGRRHERSAFTQRRIGRQQ